MMKAAYLEGAWYDVQGVSSPVISMKLDATITRNYHLASRDLVSIVKDTECSEKWLDIDYYVAILGYPSRLD